MISPVTHSENCFTGQDDTPPWDQIQPFFAYSDPPAGEQPLANEPANSGPRPVGGEFLRAEPHLKKTIRVEKEPRNELVLRGAGVSPSNYPSSYRVPPPEGLSAPPIAVSTLPMTERIGIFGITVVAVVSIVVLLVNYAESFHESVPPSSALVAQRADPLPSVTPPLPSGPPAVPSPAVSSPAVSSPAVSSPAVSSPAVSSPAVPSPASALNELATGLADDEISTLMKRGQDLLKAGDFAAARLLFKRAADAGNAQAALALASTYDPAVIGRLGAVAVSPDIDRALTWYATAADHGSVEAAERYANLARARSARVDEMIK